MENNEGMQGKVLLFLYKSRCGRAVLKLLVKPCVSKMAGRFADSRFSSLLIMPFVKYNNINMHEYEKCRYRSFNDFFTRKIKKGSRKFSENKEDLCSPCDGRLTVYKITEDASFMVKGVCYSMRALARSRKLAGYYEGGTLFVFRLCVDDYHRYAYIDAGRQKKNYKINGIFHTVNPAACEELPVYKENTREFSILESENFGKVLMMEVGAMLVGRIVNYNEEAYVARGQEKGRFEYGGSTVILAFAKDKVMADKEITRNSLHGIETYVKMGSVIGRGLRA